MIPFELLNENTAFVNSCSAEQLSMADKQFTKLYIYYLEATIQLSNENLDSSNNIIKSTIDPLLVGLFNDSNLPFTLEEIIICHLELKCYYKEGSRSYTTFKHYANWKSIKNMKIPFDCKIYDSNDVYFRNLLIKESNYNK